MTSAPARFFAWLDARFRRVTSSVAYIPQLDGLRSLALLLVIGHHVFASYLETSHRLGVESLPRDWGVAWSHSPLVAWGLHLAFGVQIFFAISGFVLALPFARTTLDRSPLPSTRLYLLRRVIRLEPPYLISMTFLFLMIVAPWSGPHWHAMVMLHIFGPHYFASIVYLHALIFGTPSWIGGIAWTLEIEIQFYLLMPILARLFKLRNATVRRAIWAVLVIAAGGFAEFVVPHLVNPRWGLCLLGNLQFFLAGVLLADVYLAPPKALRMRARTADAIALVSVAALVWLIHWPLPLAWAQPFFVIALYFAAFHEGVVAAIFRHPALTIPGTMCYTIYLYHFFLAQHWVAFLSRYWTAQHALWVDTLIMFVTFLPVLLLVSAVLYLAVERPFVVLSHRATRRWRPSTHPSVGAEVSA